MSKKKEPINYLDLTPVALYGHEVKKDGRIWILIPRFTSKFFGKYLLPILKNKYIPLKLDEMGSATYKLIDGKRTVQDICDKLTDKYGEKMQHAEERVTSFLTHLYTGKIIKLENPIKE